MRKLISFMHTSLDGMVAGPNGEMDWIHVDDDIFDYAGNMTDESDTAIYGRVTYEMMEAYWPTAADKPGASKHDRQHSAWYKQVEKIVLSKTMQDIKSVNTRIISDNLLTEINLLKQKPGKNIVLFGSPGAVHSLTALNLVDEYWLFVNPVLLGNGIPMFTNVSSKTNLGLLSSKVFTSGVNGLHYVVDRTP